MPLRYTAPQTGGGPPVGPQLWQLKGAAPSDIELNTLAGANGISAVNPAETTLTLLFNKVAGVATAAWQWVSGGASMMNGIAPTALTIFAGSNATDVGKGGAMLLRRKNSTGDFSTITSINKATKTSEIITNESQIVSRVGDTANPISSSSTQEHDSIDSKVVDSATGDESQQFQEVDKIFRTIITGPASNASETNEEADTINRTVMDLLAGTQSIMDQRAATIFEELQGDETNTLESEHDFTRRTITDTAETSESRQEKDSISDQVTEVATGNESRETFTTSRIERSVVSPAITTTFGRFDEAANGQEERNDGIKLIRRTFTPQVWKAEGGVGNLLVGCGIDAIDEVFFVSNGAAGVRSFEVLSTGEISTNQSEAPTAIDPTITARIPIRDIAGALLGYIPVMVDP